MFITINISRRMVVQYQEPYFCVIAGLSSSAVGVVDDMVSPSPWGNAIPSLLPLLANIAPRGASSAVRRTVRSDPLTPTISNLYTLSTLSTLLSTEEEIYKYSKNVIKWPKNGKKGGVNTVNTVNTSFFQKTSKFPRILPVNIR